MVPCCKFHFDKIFNTAESLGVSIRMAVKIVEEQWADSGNILASLRGQIKREKPFNPSKWHVELTGKSIEPVLWDLE